MLIREFIWQVLWNPNGIDIHIHTTGMYQLDGMWSRRQVRADPLCLPDTGWTIFVDRCKLGRTAIQIHIYRPTIGEGCVDQCEL